MGNSSVGFHWNNNQNIDTLLGLPTGTYNLTVTDTNYCKDSSLVVTITEPSKLNINVLEITNPTCFNGTNGNIDIEITGGVEDYDINWIGIDAQSEDLVNIQAGNYSVNVTDANGCKKDTLIVVAQPEGLVLFDSAYVNNYVGYIDVVTLGGTPDYYYTWSNGESGNNLENLSTGEYIVTVYDKNNCTAVDTIYLEIPLLIPTVITPNNDGKNDTWKISGISQYELISINIFNRWGDAVYTYETSGLNYSTNTDIQWDGNWNGKPLPLGTYVFVLNLNNGKEPYNGTVTIVR